ncbi:probable DNA polymerase delta subunit 4 at C-terminar half [Coccomyxa sp. Obi]|nr:probable DNA polymerase delta subunit 4 at C-terminar half [Coccomyxa sp. Obi]
MMTGNSKINYRQSKAFLDPSPHRSKLKTTRSSSSQPETSTGIAPQSSNAVDHADLASASEALKSFDLAMKYGPCTGLKRLARWQRAETLGLSPPLEIKRILEGLPDDHALQHNIWHGRV